VHIYGGKETVLEIEIAESEFSAIVPVSGTAQMAVAGGVAPAWRKIRAYSDSACASPLGMPEELGSAGGFALMIPSATAAVYLRQEAEIDGKTYAGMAHPVTLNSGNTAVTSVAVTDAFYSITLDGIPSDAVTFPAYAAEGVSVALEIGTAFILKPNTLEYNYNGASQTLSGPPYAFDMPAAAVTIAGEFLGTSSERYVTLGGGGFGLSWEDPSGDLQKMMDELAELRDRDYAGPFIVMLGAGTYTPQWKPMIPAPGDPYGYTEGGRDAAFILREGVEVQGGYPASGGGSRNITGNTTTLSGDFNHDDVMSGSGSTLTITGNGENAHHVVLAVNIPAGSRAVLDGLTISGGYADGNASVLTDCITVGAKDIYRFGGGGMYNDGASPVLDNVTIRGNTTSSGGGGMLNWGSSPVLNKVTISGNSAGTGNGGGMLNLNFSSPVLTDVTISGNTADSGGGGGIQNNESSSPVLTDVTISGNTADSGGGINNFKSSPVLVNVTIAGNYASDNGGGIYNEENSSPVLVNVTISGNTADSGGGGMYSNSSSPVLVNVTIAGNYASNNGGGMYNYADSDPEIRNSIIWGNAVGVSFPGIFNSNSIPNDDVPVISNSIVEGSFGGGSSWDNSAGTEGAPGTNQDLDPGFVALVQATATNGTTAGDYNLKPSSQAIDAGDSSRYPDNAVVISGLFSPSPVFSPEVQQAINAALATDLAGNPRTAGSAIDMGAYEKQ
jgi:hypothetical protein